MTLPQLKSHPGFLDAWRRQVSQSCPFVEPRCDPSVIYRTADGSCNNLNHSSVGAAYTRQRRMMDNSYEDGLLLLLVYFVNAPPHPHPPPTKDNGQILRRRFLCCFFVVVGFFFFGDAPLPPPTNDDGQTTLYLNWKIHCIMISRKTEAQMTNLHRRDYESTTYPIGLTNDNLQMIIKNYRRLNNRVNISHFSFYIKRRQL